MMGGVSPYIDVPPRLTPTAVDMYDGRVQANVVPGWDRDGDYIIFGYGASGELKYYDETGVLQWTKTLANVNANVDEWVGWHVTDTLVYGVAMDTGTTPATYYTFSVNQAGTLTNIGNAQPSANFTTVNGWDDRDVNVFLSGSNLIVCCEGEQMSLSTSDGSVASDPADIVAPDPTSGLIYQTADGFWMDAMLFNNASSGQMMHIHIWSSSGNHVEAAVSPWFSGMFYDSGQYLKPVVCDDLIVICGGHNSSGDTGGRFFLKTSFDAWIARIAAWNGCQ